MRVKESLMSKVASIVLNLTENLIGILQQLKTKTVIMRLLRKQEY